MQTFKQLLVHFTKSNGIYEQFMYYLAKYKINISGNINPLRLISYYMPYEEGKTYWLKISREWTQYVNRTLFIPLFVNFLKENKAYEQYVYNLKDRTNVLLNMSEDKKIETYLQIIEPKDFVSFPFFNSFSSLNSRMWSKIAFDWIVIYCKTLKYGNKIY